MATRPATRVARPRRRRGVAIRTGIGARQAKRAGASVCELCGAVKHAGRWRVGAPPLTTLQPTVCPACVRIRDRRPAGTLRLPRELGVRRLELRRLIRNVERAERKEHPLERLMGVEEVAGSLVITTTGVHLARQLAHKLAHALHRKARLSYQGREGTLRVDWA